MATRLRQFLCGLGGHDALLHFEPRRISLQCASCGYETPGWDLGSGDQARSTGVVTSPRVVRMPLARARRVA